MDKWNAETGSSYNKPVQNREVEGGAGRNIQPDSNAVSGSRAVKYKRNLCRWKKIEANANRYTFAWGRAIKKNEKRIREQVKELWEYAQNVAEEEEKEEEPADFEEIDSSKVEEAIKKIDEILKSKPISKKIKRKIDYAKRNWPKKLEKYKEQKEKLGNRNSYSKTDEDGTFMRMKEDSMKNRQQRGG